MARELPLAVLISAFLVLVGSFVFIDLTRTPTIQRNINQLVISTTSGLQASEINVPAVDNNGNGVVSKLKVQAIPGTGKILVNIDQILFFVDTQYSIQTASRVATNMTNLDLSKVDIVYSIDTQAQVIEGPSAGAALTLATIATLENRTLNRSVMITGTINPDGTIGPVGGVEAKAKAAKDIGAILFLVPQGEATQTNYVPVEKCDKEGSVTVCNVEYQEQTVDIVKSAGIDVREVKDINDAEKYFF